MTSTDEPRDTRTDEPRDTGTDETARTPGTLRDGDRRLMLVGTHVLVALTVAALWAAADAWQQVTGLRAAAALSVLVALPAGAVLATLTHEWGHFAAARVAGARYTIPARPGLFVFDFDFTQNTPQQFLWMSCGGQLGGVFGLVLLWLAIPLDSAGRCMLVAGAAGAVVLAAAIEWPVIRRVRAGGDPRSELYRTDRATLLSAFWKGLAATALVWLLL